MIDDRKKSVAGVLAIYNAQYEVLAPDCDSISLAKDVWEKWEKSGITPPDINEIVLQQSKHENGFFYDIVTIAERLEKKSLNIHYCAFCLDRYNFYAFSADDGYVVLVDDIFFQFLFFLTIILVFDADGSIENEEKPEVQRIIREMLINNYFNRKRFDFSKESAITRLFEKDYELTEFANYFFHALKTFVISHEIGHHVLEHTTGKRKRTFGDDNNNASVEVDSRDIQNEFDADNYGYKLFMEVSNTVDEKIYYAYCKYKFDFAPLFLFEIFRKLDSITEFVTGQPVNYGTHPPSWERIARLKKDFEIKCDDPLYLALMDSLTLLSI